MSKQQVFLDTFFTYLIVTEISKPKLEQVNDPIADVKIIHNDVELQTSRLLANVCSEFKDVKFSDDKTPYTWTVLANNKAVYCADEKMYVVEGIVKDLKELPLSVGEMHLEKLEQTYPFKTQVEVRCPHGTLDCIITEDWQIASQTRGVKFPPFAAYFCEAMDVQNFELYIIVQFANGAFESYPKYMHFDRANATEDYPAAFSVYTQHYDQYKSSIKMSSK